MSYKRKTIRRIRKRISKLLKEGFQVLNSEYREPIEYFVANQSKIIYVVNSKAGNSAIKEALFERETGIKIDAEKIIHEDKRVNQYRTHELPADPENYYRFSFVRNPIDRIASFYTNKFLDVSQIQRTGTGFEFSYYLGGIFSPYETFPVLIEKICEIPDHKADKHFISQYDLLVERMPSKLDLIGKLENFNEDFQSLVDRFDLKFPSKRNASSVKIPLDELYTRPILEKLFQRFENDFRYFGYEDYYKKIWSQCS